MRPKPSRDATYLARCQHPFKLDEVIDTLDGVDSSSIVNALEPFIVNRKGTRGLTPKGERWLRETLGKFLLWLPIPFTEVNTDTIISFLSQYDDKPWRKHSMYRSLRTYWKWVSMTYDLDNPFLDKHGNRAIPAPRLPSKILPTTSPDTVAILIENCTTVRNKAIVSLLADSGCRMTELVSISMDNVFVEKGRISVWGKNRKEGWLVFGPGTRRLLAQYIEESHPQESLFGLNEHGLKSMLQRLEKQTGIKCNAHTFRRGFATELRKQGLSELDIAELGRWSSTAMVKRYSRAYTFEDAASRYKAIV